MWRYRNTVEIRFGARSFWEVPGVIGGRSYALVTYGKPFFPGGGRTGGRPLKRFGLTLKRPKRFSLLFFRNSEPKKPVDFF